MEVKGALPTNLIVILIFLLPSTYSFFNYCCKNRPLPKKPAQALLTWHYIHENMPWSLIFVVGGGFAIGNAIEKTRLIQNIAHHLIGIPVTIKTLKVLVFEIFVISVFLTTFLSNVSTIELLSTFLAEVSSASRKHPLLVFYPAVISCNISFFLPVSTPPNAIACGFGNIHMKDIVRLFNFE